MSGFSAEWLALREPYDRAARAKGLEAELARWAAGRTVLDIVDLGSGTGSNLRHLAPTLPCPQRWTLVEHDPALIEAGGRLAAPARTEVRYLRADLVQQLDEVIDRHVDLVTASALIDLVSELWLDRLLAKLRQRPTALLIVLSYDGRMEFTAAEGKLSDRASATGHEAVALFNRHQRTDKGFGPALGPLAASTLERGLRTMGKPTMVQSDWVFGPDDGAILTPFVEGVAGAALEIAETDDIKMRLAAWREDMKRLTAAGGLTCSVGHQDLLFLP